MISRPYRELAAIDPRSYLDLAVELAGRLESHLARTAGDRACYAAFLTIRNLLAEKGYTPLYVGVTAHASVAQALRIHLGEGIGNEENRLRRIRNQLTYNTEAVAISGGRSIQWIIDTAREIINAVSDLPGRA